MKSYKIVLAFMVLFFLSLILAPRVKSSDHSDTTPLIDAGRHDARITDMYVFTKGSDLVLILCTDPTVPIGATSYEFPTDVEYTFNIDNNSEVGPDGSIIDRNSIDEDIVIKIRFKEDGTPIIQGQRIASLLHFPLMLFACVSSDESSIVDSITSFFAGPRDDPFIRGPRIGQNVAAIVLELPLDVVLDKNDTMLIWATTKVDGFAGKFQERFGGPFRSQVIPALNTIHPKDDFKKLGIEPDVTIINTSVPSGFPNGRLLEDDVVDLVCPGFCDDVVATDAPFPDTNDVEFLGDFPYLAPPH